MATDLGTETNDGFLLRVEGLKTYFFQRHAVLKAVDGVSFTVRPGEAVGLVGESGSGKTMTCLSLMRLVPKPGARIVEGEVWFKDRDLLRLPEHEMRQYRGRTMAMIMQDPQTSLNPVYTVGNQVAEPVKLHLKERGQAVLDRVLEALRAVRIPNPEQRLGQYPHQFSGGMRQRVVAAMGLTSVFDNKQLLGCGNLNNRVHVAHLPVEMYRNDRFRPRSDRILQEPRIHVIRFPVNIYEDGFGSAKRNGFCRRDERVWHSNDFIALANAQTQQSHPERGGSGPNPNGFSTIAKFSKISFKPAHKRPPDKSTRVQHGFQCHLCLILD